MRKLANSRSKAYKKAYYESHKEYHLTMTKKYRKKRQLMWRDVIPKIARCQICNRKIYLNHKDKTKSIHFDHRHGGKEPIKTNPSNWIIGHAKTPLNEKKWKDSNFGTLCIGCNFRIPTKGRKDWLKRITSYINEG